MSDKNATRRGAARHDGASIARPRTESALGSSQNAVKASGPRTSAAAARNADALAFLKIRSKTYP
jgi:hypothetical protein